MKVVPVYEAKNRFSELLVAAEQGEIVSITRRGAAIARLIAEPTAKQGKAEARRRIAASFARLRAWRDEVRLEGDVKALSREGAR
ncbi:MAG: type II toxin-antitoxin system prevent-host-death family antitoxin [Thiomonas sp.]|uniref:type II toxin-antitoxin system Phd/YefM family antitoxin n=1 Tax=Thiomonas sp. TaxID=2047785 RepID=UPI002A36F4EA|nr:type II toxin-antitoxin system prevent-host-death family antitoxin [Thiomonas sp.]MDY0330923.1 type II toxin-antitoxin system prevent-host-death family antitoxin [Thiomonas sp.]